MAKIRVRARAVDMLGRQQIAGIPTAIHELFKNAHDAYATRVEVDFFRQKKLLVLRDNGHGMTKDELEDRWLTLGTESKVNTKLKGSPWPELLNLKPRPIMGEKGIGRLAIAAIGPQVLVITRAIKEDGLSSPAVCLVNWRLFEVPGLDLDEIDVPVLPMVTGKYPDQQTLTELKRLAQKNIDELGSKLPGNYKKKIERDLKYADISPLDYIEYLSNANDHIENDDLDLRNQGHGTHFFVFPTNQSLEDDIDEDEIDVATPLKKNLLGFSNTMTSTENDPPLKAMFRDYLPDGRVNELIGNDNFFLPEEFRHADHHFKGEFNAYGHFKGKLQIYGKEPFDYTLPWANSGGEKTECGPFKISIAYVQGKAFETLMPPDEWTKLTNKLDLIGGLYIYREGIRILPYGNSDFDFLNIERRRTKSAQDWFFSYRRMFGVVDINHDDNALLEEKAGREGFRQNTAYRQFKAILENFTQRLAIDFFRPTSDRAQEFWSIKNELDERRRLLKKKEELASSKKSKFKKELEGFFKHIEENNPKEQLDELTGKLNNRLSSIAKLSDPELVGSNILQIEKDLNQNIEKLGKLYSVSKPRGMGLTKKLASDWEAYQKNYSRIQSELIEPVQREIQSRIDELAASEWARVDRTRRLGELFEQSKHQHSAEAKSLQKDTQEQQGALDEAITKSTKDAMHMLLNGLSNIESELRSTKLDNLSEKKFEDYRNSLVTRLDSVADREIKKLERLKSQIDVVTDAIREGESIVDMADAAEDEALAMKEELSTYTEFAQTGMAVGIIQHEFSSTVRSVREAIGQLQPWADGTPQLGKIHKSLRNSFEHLDGYLTLFTPLSRRLYRSKKNLGGEEIRRYLREVFGERLVRHNIKLKATPAFDRFIVNGYPSTFLPVFINIVDNAIYWITFDRDSEHWIYLDADKHGFLVSNGGPGIDAKDADRIFEFGESRKIGGRGMGLFISRQSLQKERWDITLESTGAKNPPIFKIFPIPKVGLDDQENDKD
ncbi:MAG: ATP-binding protein [Candidatus Thiodiazotropha taylori]|nr:ATP-binding protein [Candidatus Thiodiazotropha taylori]